MSNVQFFYQGTSGTNTKQIPALPNSFSCNLPGSSREFTSLHLLPWPLGVTFTDASAASMSKPQFMPLPAGTSLAGKTIIVTGGTSGLGLELARQALILKASRVVLSARDGEKGNAAIATLRADLEVQASNPDAKLDQIHLMLDHWDCTVMFVKKVYEQVPELDILVCNGGTNFFKYETSWAGHERLMQSTLPPYAPDMAFDKNLKYFFDRKAQSVHCYSHFFIVCSLLRLMVKTAAERGSPGRVTFLSSYSYIHHTLEAKPIPVGRPVISHFDDPKNYVYGKRYQDAKLVVNAFVQRLATKVSSSEVIINCVCPGIIATGVNQNLPLWIKPFMYVFFKIKARPVVEGGRVVIHAAVVAGAETHGKYLQKGEIHE